MTSLNTVAVLGAGTMGHGIAQVLAQHGLRVRLRDLDEGRVQAGLSAVRTNLEGALARGKLASSDELEEVLGRISGETRLEVALDGADALIEAIPEDLELKKRVLAEASLAGDVKLLGTNTSSLPVTEIAQATRYPERVLGLHFFNPVHLQALVEVVRGERSTQATVDLGLELVARINKTPVVVQDSPGFASSRLGLVLGLEAIRMVEAGVASAEAVDKAMELGYRHKMGPLMTTDYVGLDVRLSIAEHLHHEIGETFRPPLLLRRMVRAGKLGRKSGEELLPVGRVGEVPGPGLKGRATWRRSRRRSRAPLSLRQSVLLEMSRTLAAFF
ncbi:MAG: 3-hydroxyacyl-CoA dehydrogenase family protein [Planctomycetota bacterium]